MITQVLNRNEYIFLYRLNRVFFAVPFKGEYQHLKVGDKLLCKYEEEIIEAYVERLHYLLPSNAVMENIMLFDEEKYGKLHVYVKRKECPMDENKYLEEYFVYKKLLEDSKSANFNILSKKIPEDITKTKIVLPCKIINPLLSDNVLSKYFNVPTKILHYLMKGSLVIDTLDGEFISRRVCNKESDSSTYITGMEAIEYLYKRIEIKHPQLLEEDIFVNEIYVYPQYWKRMFVEDGEENGIAFAYRSLVNRCKYIVMLRNNEQAPKLVIENEKRMMYEKCVYLVQRFVHDKLLIKRW